MINAAVALVPVLAFLAALVLMDSFKLVPLRAVVRLILAGAAAALVATRLHAGLLDGGWVSGAVLSRYVAPVTEELLKALPVVYLLARKRVGFLVDAAILGFAVGAGFAIVENLQYQRLVTDAGLPTWIVRGFGTAVMHGGVTATFAMMSVAMLERAGRATPAAFVPGFALAVVLHAAYNHLAGMPLVATLAVLVVLPLTMYLVFERSERAVGDWLGRGFDADTAMLESINSGRFADSPTGRYLDTLKRRFHGPVVADLLCYLRLHTELALRAKGVLLMRENGFDVPVDEATRDKFTELEYLEKSIGRTGVLALKPMLHMSHKDLWQLYMLGK